MRCCWVMVLCPGKDFSTSKDYLCPKPRTKNVHIIILLAMHLGVSQLVPFPLFDGRTWNVRIVVSHPRSAQLASRYLHPAPFRNWSEMSGEADRHAGVWHGHAASQALARPDGPVAWHERTCGRVKALVILWFLLLTLPVRCDKSQPNWPNLEHRDFFYRKSSPRPAHVSVSRSFVMIAFLLSTISWSYSLLLYILLVVFPALAFDLGEKRIGLAFSLNLLLFYILTGFAALFCRTGPSKIIVSFVCGYVTLCFLCRPYCLVASQPETWRTTQAITKACPRIQLHSYTFPYSRMEAKHSSLRWRSRYNWQFPLCISA